VVRLYLLQSHYRSVLDLTDAGLEAAGRAYYRLLEAYRALRAEAGRAEEGDLPALDAATERLERDFAEAMNDDLGTPEALAALFSFLPELNKALAAGRGRASLERALDVMERLAEGALGLFPPRVLEARLEGPLLEGLIELLLEQREAARQRRDFASADALRARLGELGVVVEDTPAGAKWKLAPR